MVAVLARFRASSTVDALVSTAKLAVSVSGSPKTSPVPLTSTLSAGRSADGEPAQADAGRPPKSDDERTTRVVSAATSTSVVARGRYILHLRVVLPLFKLPDPEFSMHPVHL
jgi:hypothetical protein